MPLFLCSAKQENGEVEDVDDREQEEMLILAHLSAHGHRTPPSVSPSYFFPFAFCTLKHNFQLLAKEFAFSLQVEVHLSGTFHLTKRVP
jgi:hypothetical protein